MYDFTKASDLVKWAEDQYKKQNRYKVGGIGRYDADGTRQFDCCGLFKCFMWHDYSTNNARYYGKTQKDLSCEGLLAEAKEKGDISTIQEIPGVLVYMKGHMGIYVGNGKVIESTVAKYDGKKGRIYKTYFKGDGKNCDGKRATWTKWFKSPYLTYEKEVKPEPTKPSTSDNFLGLRGYLKYGDKGPNVNKICLFFANNFYGYFGNSKESARIKLVGKNDDGDFFGNYLKSWVIEFQKRCKADGLYDDEIDGCIGPKTLKCLRHFSFLY